MILGSGPQKLPVSADVTSRASAPLYSHLTAASYRPDRRRQKGVYVPVAAELGLDDLMAERRVRRWSLLRWGPADDQKLLVGLYTSTTVSGSKAVRASSGGTVL
jgi:hypothetical protein